MPVDLNIGGRPVACNGGGGHVSHAHFEVPSVTASPS